MRVEVESEKDTRVKVASISTTPSQWIRSLLVHVLSDARITYPYQLKSTLKYVIRAPDEPPPFILCQVTGTIASARRNRHRLEDEEKTNGRVSPSAELRWRGAQAWPLPTFLT